MKKILNLILIFSCFNFLNAQENINVFNIQNLNINTENADFGVSFYKDNLVLFASSKKDRALKRKDRSHNRMQYLQFYKGRIADDGQIILEGLYSDEKYNMFHESDITFSPNGKTIYFTLNNYIQDGYRKIFIKSSEKEHILNIFRATINDNGIATNIEPVPFNGKNYSVSNPELSPDGKTLYFSSNMDGGYGKNDIYKVAINEDGTYGNPENLGAEINTKYNEFFPFLSTNNTFYFTSDGHGGKGFLDIYSSNFSDDNYTTPTNLSDVNSKYDDFAFVISPEQNVGYFSSSRKGKGNADIYSFLTEAIECNQTITGIVRNIKTNEIITNSEVKLFNDGNLSNSITTNTNGEFKFDIDCEENYTINASKIDFIESNETTFTSSKVNSKNTDYTLYLEPIECLQTIAGIVRNEETNEVLANTDVKLSNDTGFLDTIKTNKNGEFKFDIDCETTYIINASKIDFIESSETNFTSSKVNSKNTDFTLYLKPLECLQTIAGIVKNEETNEILANTDVKLSNDTGFAETIKTNNKGEFKFNIDCETTYTINASKIDFIESDGTTFTSSKVNSKNTDFTLYLKPIECLQTISGIVRNEETNEVLANTDVKLSNDTGFINTIKTNKKGEFKFDIECETTYVIKASKTYFIESEETVFSSTKENTKNTDLTLYLEPIECKQNLAGIVTNKETFIPIQNVTVSLFQNSIVIEKAITKANGTFTFNTLTDCKTQYKVVAEIETHNSKTENIITSDNPNEKKYLELELKETDDFITYKNIKMIKTKPIYFDLNEDEIRRDAAIELDKVIRIMIKYPSIKIELKSHTDSRAPDEYNMSLSKRRASSSVEYIISHGINSNRITGEGYGETRLVNKCSNNVKCSEEEHQKNRRTEFIVISE